MLPEREGLMSAVLYEREIHALAGRAREQIFHGHGELSAPLVAAHAAQVARRLAAEVGAGEYAFSPLVPYPALLNGKPRTIYRVDPLDAVVFSALGRVLSAAIEPRLGTHLYSYRKGRSQWTACRALLRYLRAHARARRDPRSRGVFVLRRDVRRYDEHIPVADDSRLWTILEGLTGGAAVGYRGDFAAFLRRAFRPAIARPDGSARPLDVGMPTGLPMQTIACNTYLLPLDAEMTGVRGAFYARFGDDLLFAHPDLEVVDEAARALDAAVARLGLAFNPDKSHAIWLTRPGRPHERAARFVPAARLAYLGFEVGFDGARLRADKRRRLLSSLHARLANADRLLSGSSPEERADVLCEVVRCALDRTSRLSDHYAAWLELDVMSLADLRQLDHHVALAVAERLTGVRGPRALRRFAPGRLRAAHGLPSLVHRYTQARAGGRSG